MWLEDLGPNIMALSARFWIKPGRDGSFVSWHQDSAYFGLDPHELVTVWLALIGSNKRKGCIRVLPRSHRGKSYSHIQTFDEKNLLARGQMIEALDDRDAVDLEIKAGQFSCHQEPMIHGSLSNETNEPRIGIGIFYFPTHVKATIGRRTACLVRGVDKFHHWDADPLLNSDLDERIRSHVHAAGERYVDPNYVQETDR